MRHSLIVKREETMTTHLVKEWVQITLTLNIISMTQKFYFEISSKIHQIDIMDKAKICLIQYWMQRRIIIRQIHLVVVMLKRKISGIFRKATTKTLLILKRLRKTPQIMISKKFPNQQAQCLKL